MINGAKENKVTVSVYGNQSSIARFFFPQSSIFFNPYTNDNCFVFSQLARFCCCSELAELKRVKLHSI